MRKLSARLIHGLLTVDQKHIRQNMSRANPTLLETDSDKFLLRFVTMDKHWFVPETKQQS